MSFILHPWQLLLVILVGWVHREQQKIIEFYQAELEAMMRAQGKKRLSLTDDQRRLLAVKGKSLGRKILTELTTIVTPVEDEGVESVRLPPRSPNLTPHIERFMRSIKEKCLLK
jgi:hypothetical protein